MAALAPVVQAPDPGGHDGRLCNDQHDPDLMPGSLSSSLLQCSAPTNCFAVPLSQRKPDQHRMLP